MYVYIKKSRSVTRYTIYRLLIPPVPDFTVIRFKISSMILIRSVITIGHYPKGDKVNMKDAGCGMQAAGCKLFILEW